ncbi:hypothetical protein E8E12_001583 [Didymella heteroderae]|uniref:C3H1-type domain-containing protein n=1 Tax=Didymella heteroderae TaxID=1769908 RepID=A0A9P4WGR5_9PLEO|nr:hypothetical protein E8E12_001583 [Didymella heteroderae]
MALPSGVRYSILRNNVEVPLIPIDQLPFHIQGLPRELTPFRKHEEGWKSIGETHEPAVPVFIRAPSDMLSGSPSPSVDTNRQFLPPDHVARKGPVVVSRNLVPPSEPLPSSVVLTGGLVNRLASTLPGGRLASTRLETSAVGRSEGGLYQPYRLPNSSGIEPDPSRKEYCTHWIRTNSCDFMQQGCKYKHEMPDREKLKELGFAETPKWYRDKMAISGGASNWLRPRATEDDSGRQLSVEPSASRAFRPFLLGLGRDQLRPAELPVSPPPKSVQPSKELASLIDLDDYTMETMSLPPSLLISSPPDAMSHIAERIIGQPLEQATETLASSLRQNRSDVEELTQVPTDIDTAIVNQALVRQKSGDTVSSATAMVTKDIADSSAATPSQIVSSGLGNGKEAGKLSHTLSKATDREPSIVKLSLATRPWAKRNSNTSKQQQRRNPRQWKLAERLAASSTPDGEASSQFATGRKPREGSSPSKGPQRGEIQVEARGKDLHLEIIQCQRGAHVKGRFSKEATSNGV